MQRLTMFALFLAVLAPAPQAEAGERTADLTGKIQSPADDSTVKTAVFTVKGTLAGAVSRGHGVFLVLEDQFGLFYLQAPAVSVARSGKWSHGNVRFATAGLVKVHLVHCDQAATGALKTLIKEKLFRGREKLPDGHTILDTITVNRGESRR